jgi:tRNA G18 (ribose-2'-O)-methylase SpoU
MKFQIDPNLNFVAVLDNIRSLENIGSIFRTGDALGLIKFIFAEFREALRIPRFQKQL